VKLFQFLQKINIHDSVIFFFEEMKEFGRVYAGIFMGH